MFRSMYQNKFFSVLYSTENNPLRLWRKIVKNGHIKCVMDEELKSIVIEVQGINTRTTYITCPVDPEGSLGIRQPFLNMLLKKTGDDFSFEITIIDDINTHRQICVSTWQTAKNKKCLCVVQLRLSTSWDYFNINLAKVTNALFGTRFVETVKIKINANCQIRSVYFSDKVYSNDELPRDYRLNLSGVSQTGPGGPAATAGTSVLVPDGSGRHRQGLHHPRSGMQAAAAGEEYICGFYTILNSTDKEPLKFWATEVENGHIQRVVDREIKSSAIEVQGRNLLWFVSRNWILHPRSTCITCPPDSKDKLGISLPFLNLLLKKTGEDFSCKITVTDDKSIQRRVILTTFTKKTKVMMFTGCVPLKLSNTWVHININLAKLINDLFGTIYLETVKIKIHASCRIRSVYFSDRLYSNEELPSDYRMEGSQSEPGLNTMVADMSSLVLGGYGDQGSRKAVNKPRVDIALQTTAAGEEYSRGFHTILYSIGWSPLKFWKKVVKNGHIERVMDEEIKSSAIEVYAKNTRTTYITCPPDPEESLGIKQPVLNLLVKKTGEDFSFEITVTDDKKIQRRILQTTFRKEMKAMVYVVCVPLILAASWEHININLAELTNELFGTKYVETVKVQIHANCRIRRVYFTNRIYADKDLPKAFKVNVVEESKPTPGKTEKVDDKSTRSDDQDRINELNKQIGAPLPTSFTDYIRGIQSVLNSVEKDPLRFWKKKVEHGNVGCVMDKEINSLAVEVHGRNMETTHITCPPDSRDNLSIRQPILNLVLKMSGEDFGCKITVTDEKIVRRLIILTTFTKKTKAKMYSGFVPVRLSTSWEHLIFNLADITNSLFKTKYVETVKIKIHANCRIRSVYFSDRLYSNEELPTEYRVNILGESPTTPSITVVKADVLPPEPSGSGLQSQRRILSIPRMESGRQTPVTGEEHNQFQTVLYSIGWSPLKSWKKEAENGHIERVMDEDLNSSAIEVQGRNMQTTYITCPVNPEGSLGIKLPILNMLLKKTGEDFSFEITVIDDTNVRRQIVQTTFRKEMRAMVCVVCFPLRLSDSWERIDFNLAELTKELFRTKYVETAKIQIHANCRIRRIYFSDRLYCNEELPKDFKLSISEENQPTPSPYSIESAMKLSPVPVGSQHQGHRKGPSNRRTEPGSPSNRRAEPGSPSNRRTGPGSLSNRRTGPGSLSSPITEPGSLTAARRTGSEHRHGFHTILDSVEKEPLKIWQKETRNGQVSCIMDEIITSSAIEVEGRSIHTTYITCPSDPESSLGIRLPFFNLLLKKTGESFGFEITMIDNKDIQRRIYLGSYIKDSAPHSLRWTLKLSDSWQYFCLNLADVTSRVFMTKYIETVKIKIHPNCRIRRVYFTDRLYSYEELPSDYKVNISTKGY